MENLNLFGYQIEGLIDRKGQLLDYAMAGNGLWVKAERKNLSACIPVSLLPPNTVRGLPNILAPFVKLAAPPVPKKLLLEIWRHCVFARNKEGNLIEIVFHLWWENGWEMEIPPQHQTAASCRPIHGESYEKALIEIHSHGSMPAFFSTTDNADETGFRIYAVLGPVDSPTVELAVRVGVYRHYWELPASEIFELPLFIRSACNANLD